MSVESHWDKLKEIFLKETNVKKQGESLKINKKMFAMLNKGNFVLKLPASRVTELVSQEIGKGFDAGTGKIQKEWVIIQEINLDTWVDLTKEAKSFALSIARK